MSRIRIVGHEEVDPGSIQPHPLNYREHPDAQRSVLDGSLSEYGWIRSVLVNKRTGHLLDGHLRLAAAQERGDVTIPVEYIDVPEPEERGILAILDPIAGMATANATRYADLIAGLEIQNQALADFMSSVVPLARPGLIGPDELPEHSPPRTHPGSLWTLGRHRLLCGDATHREDVLRLLPPDERRPLLMVTDPPYGVDYDPAWRVKLHAEGRLDYSGARLGPVPNDDRSDWQAAFELFPGDVVYSWSPAGPLSFDFFTAISRAGFHVRMQIIWAKPHFPISRGHYHVRHEPCLYAVREGADDHWDVEHEPLWYAVRKDSPAEWAGGRKQSTLWNITLDPNVPGGHSTQKPVECMARPIRNHRGDVYDPFMGSGTTLIAAEQAARTCYGMDIDPRYCDVAVARWEAFTGREATVEHASAVASTG